MDTPVREIRQSPAQARRVQVVAEACRRIDASDELPDLSALAEAAGMSRFHFHRVFRQVTGMTPKAYAQARRATRVQTRLAAGARVTDAIHDAGFGSSSPFYADATATIGMSPRHYRAGGAGQEIRFAIAQCTLGALLVAASERGVCAILLDDDPEKLLQSLQQRFPRARLIGADGRFEQWVARIVGFIEAPGIGLDLPLDLQGTAFQRRVWQALRRIPVGETISYAELAQRVGLPRAVRAVAQACGANPVALAVPCHRVVRTDGGLSGYRWGIARKREMLDRERVARQKLEKSKSMSSGTGTS